ncbi:MAG: hypothetical protein GEU88_15690, partial [Solirubrobacterales bacterium]|nr:hypothetical protein [Solirubrobacterales bacterium]
VSRLARNSADWHRLLEICALTDTLILDEDGIYDPTDFNDRLLLGLKGTMSEAELHLIRARLDGGLQTRRSAASFASRCRSASTAPTTIGSCSRPTSRCATRSSACSAFGGGWARRARWSWSWSPRARSCRGERSESGASAGRGRVMAPCMTCSPTPPMPARSCSGAPALRSASTKAGGCGRRWSSCRPSSGPSACASTIPAMSPGPTTSQPASACGPT